MVEGFPEIQPQAELAGLTIDNQGHLEPFASVQLPRVGDKFLADRADKEKKFSTGIWAWSIPLRIRGEVGKPADSWLLVGRSRRRAARRIGLRQDYDADAG